MTTDVVSYLSTDSTKIPIGKYPIITTISVGQTAHVNHLNCPAGEDTKKRLYITRKTGTFSVGYCHNCGNSGFHLYGKSSIAMETRFRPSACNSAPTVDYKGLDVLSSTDKLEDCPWIPKEMNAKLLHLCGFRKLDTHSMCFPVRNVEGMILGVQARRFSPVNGLPKYTFHQQWPLDAGTMGKVKHNTDKIFYPSLRRLACDTVVLTEDALSASCIAIANMSIHVVSLLGTNLPDDLAAQLVLGYKNVIVWLDNDAPAIIKKGRQIANRLEAAGLRAFTRTGLVDPKSYTFEFLRTSLTTDLSVLTEPYPTLGDLPK